MKPEQTQYFIDTIVNIPDNNSGTYTGTIIKFNRTNTLYNVIKSNFDPSRLVDIPVEDRLYIIYGLFKKVTFSASIDDTILYLNLYNYFDLPDDLYYNGIMRSTINVYEQNKESSKNKILFLLVNPDYENLGSYFEPVGAGYSKKITKNKHIPNIIDDGYTQIGVIKLNTGMMCDDQYEYAVSNYIQKKCVCGKCVLDMKCTIVGKMLQDFQPYDKEHYMISQPIIKNNEVTEKKSKEYLSKLKIIRNNQVIGVSNIEKQTIGNLRGSSESNQHIFQTRCELYYQTISNQKNKMDKIFHIQENKNQYNENVLDKALSRLVWYIKTEKHKNIWEYFMNKYQIPLQEEPINNEVDEIPLQEEPINNHVDEIPNSEEPINNEVDEIPNSEEPINNHVDEIKIIPKYTKIFIPHKNTSITVDQGIEILKKIKLNIDNHSDILNKMICAYSGNCAPFELIEVLNFITPNEQKYNCLMHLIEKIYNENPNRSSMKYGIELYNYYSNIK